MGAALSTSPTTTATALARELGCSRQTVFRLQTDGLLEVQFPAGAPPRAMLPTYQEVARAEAERSLEGKGRLVLRASGTEPVVRVTVEAQDAVLMESVLDSLSAVVKSAV